MLEKIVSSLTGKKKEEPIVAVDIGTSMIKVMELDMQGDVPKLLSAGMGATPAGAISNNIIAKVDEVASVIREIIKTNEIHAGHACTAIPGPSVFTKKISMTKMDDKDLENNIGFEAGNYIPHNINQVYLDYQVVGSSQGNAMDVLLVAVKNEVVSSYLNALEAAGLVPTIVDVDYFAMGNMFEMNYPDEFEKTVALVNIGARYTAIDIIENREPLFSGDVGVGGRLYTDGLCETINISPADAEKAKMGDIPEGIDATVVAETIERTTEHIVSELHRQLGFFWNAAATDKPIEAIYVLGGGSQVKGLVEELSSKAGLECHSVQSFKNLDGLENFDSEYLKEIGPSMGVSVGLAFRRLGDKRNIRDC